MRKAWDEWSRCSCGRSISYSALTCGEADHWFMPDTRPELIVMLLPANRVEQAWWQDYVEPYRDRAGFPLRVEFLRGRLRFIKPGQTEVGPNERPPFGCCLLIWGEGLRPKPVAIAC